MAKLKIKQNLPRHCLLLLLPNSVFNTLYLYLTHFCYLLILGIYIRLIWVLSDFEE